MCAINISTAESCLLEVMIMNLQDFDLRWETHLDPMDIYILQVVVIGLSEFG